MNKRRKLSREERIDVFNKTLGHCAYCGSELRLADMQVDHLVPLYNGGTDNMANYLPACRSCNHYKSTLDIEKFRAALERMPDVLRRDNRTYRIAVRFGLVTPTPHSVRFYFEDNPPKKAVSDIYDEGRVDYNRLSELAQADKEGRCVVLPCKIGDTVYSIRHERVPDDEYRMSFHTEMRIVSQKFGLIHADCIGKSVFLNREEAEAALRREQE